jgi:imidazolonepropionase-like amidohydrolase
MGRVRYLLLLISQLLPAAVAIKNVIVIDVNSGVRMPPQTILVEGDRVQAVGSKVPLPKSALLIDGRGKFAIPGLWDMHVHLWEQENVLPLYLSFGVTGVRDMGSDPKLVAERRREIASGVPGPTIISPGAAMDGRPSDLAKLPILVVTDSASAHAAVQQAKQNGADFVKVLSRLSRSAFVALMEEAGSAKLPVAGHVPDSVSAWDAITERMASVEHLFGVYRACSSKALELDAKRATALERKDRAALAELTVEYQNTFDVKVAREFFRQCAAAGVRHTPSLTLWDRMTYRDGKQMEADPLLGLLPEGVRKTWTPDPEPPAERVAALAAERKRIYSLVPLMKESGVEILAGTDSGDPFTIPGATLHQELVRLVEAGLTPLEALRTATRNPARFLGRTVGIQAGASADLLLLDADPLLDIRNTTRIHGVVSKGRYFDASELRALQERVKSTQRATSPSPAAR